MAAAQAAIEKSTVMKRRRDMTTERVQTPMKERDGKGILNAVAGVVAEPKRTVLKDGGLP